jgi:cytochrome c peroxidase
MNPRFDRFMRGEKSALTASEKNGFNVFMGKAKCGTCHFTPLVNGIVPPDSTETEFEIIGVLAHPVGFKNNKLDEDQGGFNLHKMQLYKNAFKPPTLRNIALTAPYMHNGVFKTLEEVIEFYDLGGGAGIGLDISNHTLRVDRLNLKESEEASIIAFLKTLTDTADISAKLEKLPVLKRARFLKRKIGGDIKTFNKSAYFFKTCFFQIARVWSKYFSAEINGHLSHSLFETCISKLSRDACKFFNLTGN